LGLEGYRLPLSRRERHPGLVANSSESSGARSPPSRVVFDSIDIISLPAAGEAECFGGGAQRDGDALESLRISGRCP
jgi:hypothetical protein